MSKRIAICAPATPITREQAVAVTSLAQAEFPELELDFHEQCFAVDGHFAGPDAMRLAAFLECANDPGSAAVWFAKGGYGSNRLLPDSIEGLGEAACTKRNISAIRTAVFCWAHSIKPASGGRCTLPCRSTSAVRTEQRR